MMRILLAAVGVALLAAGESQAAGRGPGGAAAPAAGGCPSCGARDDGGGRYGLLPYLRAGWTKKSAGCATCRGGGGAGMHGPYGPGGPGMGMGDYPGGLQGTLGFPTHFYNRGPRDFFMWERR